MKTRRHFLKHLLGLTAFSAAAQSIFAGVQPILATVQRFFSRAHPQKVETGGARPVRLRHIESHIRETFQKRSIGVKFGEKVYNLDRKQIRFPLLGKSGLFGIDGKTPADRYHKANLYLEWIGTRMREGDLRDSTSLFVEDPTEAEEVPFNLNRPLQEMLTELFEYPRRTRLSLNGTLIVVCDIYPWHLKPRLHAGKKVPKYFKEHPICYAGPGKTLEGLPSGSAVPNPAGHLPDNVEFGEFEKLEMEGVWKIDVVSLPATFYVNNERNDFFLSIHKHKFLPQYLEEVAKRSKKGSGLNS